LKKIILACLALWLLCACSSSDPAILDATASDNNPTVGQKILFQVRSVADHFPMTYSWSADGGTFDPGTSTDNFAYWTAPDEPGTYRVRCTVTDDDGNTDTHTFVLPVSARTVEVLYPASSTLTMEKQDDSIIGGIWVSLQNGQIRYITSTSDADTGWVGAFGTIHVAYSPLAFAHALWGALPTGKTISQQSGSGTSSIAYTTGPEDDVINAMIVSLAESEVYYLLVGSDSGLHFYNATGETGTWTDDDEDFEKVYAFAESSDGQTIHAATDQGIYSLPYPHYSPTKILDGDSCALALDAGDAVWHVTGGQVCKDGVALGSQPAVASCTLDIDPKGNVWCGKYFWNGTAWSTPDALAGYTVEKVVASTEGLVYFITDSGALLRY
jgi:hypothetical protein